MTQPITFKTWLTTLKTCLWTQYRQEFDAQRMHLVHALYDRGRDAREVAKWIS